MELEDKDERTFEDFLAFLQLHPELKTWEIGPEPILSLPGLQIYPDRRKIYHGQQEIELNTKEFALLCLLVTNKGRVLTYGQMYEKVWKEEPFGNEHIAVGSHVRSMRQKLYAIYPKETRSRIDPQKAGVRQGVSGNSLHHSAGESEGHSCQPGSQRPGHTHFQHNHSNTRSLSGGHNRFRKDLEATASNAGADGENH